MKSILEKRGSMQIGMVIAWIIAIAVLLSALGFLLFPTTFSSMVKNLLPNVKTTTDSGYDVIAGSDEEVPVSARMVFSGSTPEAKESSFYYYTKNGKSYINLKNYGISGLLWGSESSEIRIVKKSGMLILTVSKDWLEDDNAGRTDRNVGYITSDGIIYLKSFNMDPSKIGWADIKTKFKKEIVSSSDPNSILRMQYLGESGGLLVDLNFWALESNFYANIRTNLIISDYQKLYDSL